MSTRTALVTGASRGIGKACAKLWPQPDIAWWWPLATWKSWRKRASEIRASGGEAFVVAMDMSIAESISERHFGSVRRNSAASTFW